MSLNEKEQKHLKQRLLIIRIVPWLTGGLTLGFLGLLVWLLLRKPIWLDPFAVLDQLGDGSLPGDVAVLMAGLFPVVLWMVFLLVAVLLTVLWIMVVHERRYLRIIDRLHRETIRDFS